MLKLKAIRGFVIVAVLGPALYGIWNVLKIFIYTAEFLGLGTTHAMVRQIPFNKGKGLDSENVAIMNTASSSGLFLSVSVALFAVLLTFTPWISDFHLEVRLAGLTLVLTYLFYFAKGLLNANKELILLGQYKLAFSILNAVFGLSLLFLFQIKGLLLGMILSQSLLLLHLILKKHIVLSFRLNSAVLKRLLSIGFPIMVLSVAFFLMQKIDSIIIFLTLGSANTGYYGLASFIALLIYYNPIT